MKVAVVLTHTREGSEPSPEGMRRLLAAGRMLANGQVDRILMAGGLPDATGTSLAALYRLALIRLGVGANLVEIESCSRDTAETIAEVPRRVATLWRPGCDHLVFVSNQYHLRRVRRMVSRRPEYLEFHLEFMSSHADIALADRMHEAAYLVYTLLDPRWRSPLAETWRRRRARRCAAARASKGRSCR